MKNSLLLCLSFVQIGTNSFNTPAGVIQLSKKRISEQIQKNYAIDAIFDSDQCGEVSNYESQADGIFLRTSPKILRANLFLSYQDLIEGQKINFPIDPNLKKSTETKNSEFAAEASSSSSRIWLVAVGVGLIGGILYFTRSKGEVSAVQQNLPKVGIVRSF